MLKMNPLTIYFSTALTHFISWSRCFAIVGGRESPGTGPLLLHSSYLDPPTLIHQGILHLGFDAVVYHIWQERNARIHGKGATPVRTIAATVLQIVKCKLHSVHRFQKVKDRPWFAQLAI